MSNTNKLLLFDPESGEKVELSNGIETFEWSETDEPPMNIRTSYSFQCSAEVHGDFAEFVAKTPAMKRAQTLADKLNDLVEEFHAPGTSRRERRAIQRQFDKTFRSFQIHCQAYNIDYKFQKTD